jgi:hypothetical protein
MSLAGASRPVPVSQGGRRRVKMKIKQSRKNEEEAKIERIGENVGMQMQSGKSGCGTMEECRNGMVVGRSAGMCLRVDRKLLALQYYRRVVRG